MEPPSPDAAADRPLASRLGDVHTVLVLVPSVDGRDDEACADLLRIAEPDRENLLSITFSATPNERAAMWQTHVGETVPANAAVVAAGDGTRVPATRQELDGVTVRTVETVDDLTALGVAATELVETWDGDGRQLVACIHGLDALLAVAELDRVFRFLHVLTGLLSSADAVTHIHLDPTTFERQVVGTLSQLADAIVEFEDGSWTITRR